MDRIALSKRLEGLSDVFASATPIARDLKAMAYVLANMNDASFGTILNPSYTPEAVEASVEQPAAPVVEEKTASEAVGSFWTKAASAAVLNNLVRDVVGMNKSVCCDTGRHLDKVQMPDGDKKAEKPAQLKDDQTPSIKESLKSGIVEKSHGKVQKEAAESKDAGMNAVVNKSENYPPAGFVKKDEGLPTDKEAAKVQPADKKVVEDKEVKKDVKKEEKEATVLNTEGIEMNPTMDDVEMSSEEAANLSKLF